MKNLLIALLLMPVMRSSSAYIINGQNAFQKNSFTKGQSFISSFGKRKRIVLADQTEVILNSNTTLWLDKNFGKENRNVRIAGDALFSIKKNSKPFVIFTPHLVIKTLKAIAKVNAYAGMAGEETLLLSGKLNIVKSYYSNLDHEPYVLKDGEMVMINKDIDLMEKETFEINELKTWIGDTFVVKNASLNELINKLKNWYNIDINIGGKVPGNLRFSGTFIHPGLLDILGTVSKAWKFGYQARENTVLWRF